MRRIFPYLVAAAALLAAAIMYAFVLSGETANTRPVPDAGGQAR